MSAKKQFEKGPQGNCSNYHAEIAVYLGCHSLKYILLLAPVTLHLSEALREGIDL